AGEQREVLAGPVVADREREATFGQTLRSNRGRRARGRRSESRDFDALARDAEQLDDLVPAELADRGDAGGGPGSLEHEAQDGAPDGVEIAREAQRPEVVDRQHARA